MYENKLCLHDSRKVCEALLMSTHNMFFIEKKIRKKVVLLPSYQELCKPIHCHLIIWEIGILSKLRQINAVKSVLQTK